MIFFLNINKYVEKRTISKKETEEMMMSIVRSEVGLSELANWVQSNFCSSY